ncbi:MAG: hypothetical protein IJU36_01425 [Paludibacteraceae bacterium]|nr:hypothetical protein [Paludibacteraceae bacterium]
MKKFQTMACVAMLTSAIAFTGCKSNDDVEPGMAGEVVKTQFSIALPNQLATGGPNRMPKTTVQEDGIGDFQGMTGIKLMPFAKQAAIISTDTRVGSNITLGDLAKAEVGTNSNAKVYEDVSIPLSTGSFLFYAKSAKTGTKFETGALTPSPADLDANPSGLTFNLEQIQATGAAALFAGDAAGTALLAYLNSIAQASDGQPTPKMWYEYTAGMDPAMNAMFTTFTSMKGLSSFEVERVLTDLYKSLKPLSSPIATAVKAAINNGEYATINGSDEVELIAAYDNFPAAFNLPDGSVNIKWVDGSHAFTNGDYANMAALDRYVYPAQLWYYANSTIQTSNTSKKTMYDNVNDWATILAAHTDAASVNTLTRAVAIVNPIQYAVARLDVAVKLNGTSLADNSDLAEGIATPVDCSAGFPVTAILVGGQQGVKFDFTTNDGTEYTVYDNVMTPSTLDVPATMLASTTLSAYNSTLLLENGTSDVQIAVEMVNNGLDFYGFGNQLIPHGGKFYVVAQLTAAAATETGGHVFKQDYKTIANLTLKSLKNAYNTIPDLRTPQLELGFSVDLSWQSGHTYDVNIE